MWRIAQAASRLALRATALGAAAALTRPARCALCSPCGRPGGADRMAGRPLPTGAARSGCPALTAAVAAAAERHGVPRWTTATGWHRMAAWSCSSSRRTTALRRVISPFQYSCRRGWRQLSRRVLLRTISSLICSIIVRCSANGARRGSGAFLTERVAFYRIELIQGWVEQRETHQFLAATMGFAPLTHPTKPECGT
jgi:hypothetical protein